MKTIDQMNEAIRNCVTAMSAEYDHLREIVEVDSAYITELENELAEQDDQIESCMVIIEKLQDDLSFMKAETALEKMRNDLDMWRTYSNGVAQ